MFGRGDSLIRAVSGSLKAATSLAAFNGTTLKQEVKSKPAENAVNGPNQMNPSNLHNTLRSKCTKPFLV